MKYGLDYSDFLKFAKDFEALGGDMDEIAVEVLEAGAEPAVQAYRAALPVGAKKNPQGHARDNVFIDKPQKSKRGTHYRVVRIKGDRRYLFMMDKGTSHMSPKPWRKKAENDVREAANPAMLEKLKEKINEKI